MDHRKYERLRGKAKNVFDETSSLKSRLSLCRRHFFTARSPFQQPRQQPGLSARQMTSRLAAAAAPLFALTDRQPANLWTVTTQASAVEKDLQCLDNFVRAVDEDLASVVKLVEKSVNEMAMPGKGLRNSVGNNDEEDVEAWRRRYFELTEDMERFLAAIDGLDSAVEAANIANPSSYNSLGLPLPSSSSLMDTRSVFERPSQNEWSRLSIYQPQERSSLSHELRPNQQSYRTQRQSFQPSPFQQRDQQQHAPRFSTRTVPSVSPVQNVVPASTAPQDCSLPPQSLTFPAHRSLVREDEIRSSTSSDKHATDTQRSIPVLASGRASQLFRLESTMGSFHPGTNPPAPTEALQRRTFEQQFGRPNPSAQLPPVFACDVESSRLPPLVGIEDSADEVRLSPIRQVSPDLDNNNNSVEADGYGMGPYIAPLELPVSTDLKLDVSFFNSPWSVFVFLPENNARDYIADRMTKFYSATDEGRDRYFQEFPKPGTTVAVYYYCDKTWNRGVVLKILQPVKAKHSNFLHQDRALVLFLDYGNTEKCPLNHLRKLSNCFTYFNAQTASCALSGIGPVGLDQWPKFYINTHQYLMADEFEDRLNGRIEMKHGRRFLELKAFKGTKFERSMADLLMDNGLAEPLADDAIVKRTAFPSPCPLDCPHQMTLEGECRHGFVLTPVEDLGVFSRLKEQVTTTSGDADFGLGPSSATKHRSSPSPTSTNITHSSPWNSRDKLPELLRVEMGMFYDESQKRDMEVRIVRWIADMKRTKSSISGLDLDSLELLQTQVGVGGNRVGGGVEGILRPRRHGSKTIITVPIHMRDEPGLRRRESLESGFDIPAKGSSSTASRVSLSRPSPSLAIPANPKQEAEEKSSDFSSSPLCPPEPFAIRSNQNPFGLPPDVRGGLTTSASTESSAPRISSHTSVSASNVIVSGFKSRAVSGVSSAGSNRQSGSPFFSSNASATTKVIHDKFSRPASDGSNRESTKSSGYNSVTSDATRREDAQMDTKERCDLLKRDSITGSKDRQDRRSESLFQSPENSAFRAFTTQRASRKGGHLD